MSWLSGHKYTILSEDEGKDSSKVHVTKGKWWFTVFLASISCFAAGYGAHEVLNQTSATPKNEGPPFELQQIQYHFRYNRSFSEAPSAHTNRAWREIFPIEGGFFVNDRVAPERATFSVFHTLHCLDNIRKSYWAFHDAAIMGTQLLDQDVHVDIQPSHVRHCIDLIRQNLMCSVDTTLELVDESINGVHGFRVPHVCRDWDQLVAWTSEQQRRKHVEQIV